MASSTNLTARLVGGVFGVAVLGALLASGDRGHAASGFVGGLHGLYVCAALAAAGAVVSARFIRSQAPKGPPSG